MDELDQQRVTVDFAERVVRLAKDGGLRCANPPYKSHETFPVGWISAAHPQVLVGWVITHHC